MPNNAQISKANVAAPFHPEGYATYNVPLRPQSAPYQIGDLGYSPVSGVRVNNDASGTY